MGLKIHKKIDNTEAINIVEGVVFKLEDIVMYKEIYERIKQDGILKNTSKFEDRIWNLDDGLRVYSFIFDFNEDVYNMQKMRRNISFTYDEFIMCVKCFILLLYKKISLHNILATFTMLRDICIHSYIFNYEYIANITEFGVGKLHTYRRFFTIEFLEFMNWGDDIERFRNEFKQILDECNVPRSKRKLGSYESMFRFNEIIDEFWNNGNSELKDKYFPIVLWWKVSTIIPIRTIEFTVIPKECCYGDNGKYYIIVNRSNQKGKRDEDVKYSPDDRFNEQHLEITKDIYDLIMEYKKNVDKYDDVDNFYGEYEINSKSKGEKRIYLLSNRGLWKHLSKTGKYQNSCKSHQEYFSPSLLNSLLKSFLIEVVKEDKGISVVEKSDVTSRIVGDMIDNVQLMDTRHFAFANMAIQGVSPITMKYMGGHKDIDSAYHYYSHLPNFVKSYTYSLSKRLSYQRLKKDNTNHSDFLLNLNFSDIENRGIHIKRLFSCDDGTYRIINGEKCMSVDFPNSCLKVDNECSDCPYWHPSEKKLDKIKSRIDEVNKEIDSTLTMMKYLVQDYTHIISPDSKIKQQSNELNSLVNLMVQLTSDYIV